MRLVGDAGMAGGLHTARPWMGRNAIHRAGRLLAAVADHEPRRPVIDGCEFREALQAVAVEGGVAGNVVPDRAVVTLNHRFAPDRTTDEARAAVEAVLAPHLEPDDEVELVDVADAAPPALSHPLLAALRARNDLPSGRSAGRVSRSRRPASPHNFGPGVDAGHRADERRAGVVEPSPALEDLLRHGTWARALGAGPAPWSAHRPAPGGRAPGQSRRSTV